MADMGELERMLYGDVENDAELEAELRALQGGSDEEDLELDDSPPPRRVVKPAPAPTQARKGPPQNVQAPSGPAKVAPRTSFGEIDRLARQISVEAVIQDDDNDDSVEHDSDLLGELDGILDDSDTEPSPQYTVKPTVAPRPGVNQHTVSSGGNPLVHLLQERLEMYKAAETAAKQNGDSSKQRRMNRGIKTLESQLRSAKAGKAVNQEEIPPVVAGVGVKHVPSPPLEQISKPAPAPRAIPPNQSQAAAAVQGGDSLPRDQPPPVMPKPKISTPVKPVVLPKISLQAPKSTVSSDPYMAILEKRRDAYKEAAIRAKSGSDKMQALQYLKTSKQFEQVIEAINNGQEVDLSDIPPSPPGSPSPLTARQNSGEKTSHVSEEHRKPKKEIAKPPPPKTVMEALTQRLKKYKSAEQEAKEEGNDRKARQMGRIQKQYEAAIRAHKLGKPVEFEELPTPPGFAPIPVPPGTSAPRPSPVALSPGALAKAGSSGTALRTAGADAIHGQRRPAPPSPEVGAGPSPPKQSRQEQQLQFLIQRQTQFKTAAIAAKKKGDMPSAKRLLKQAKGFDQMIEASRAGMPVDITKTPVPPQAVAGGAALKPQVSVSETGEETGDLGEWTMVQGGRDEIFATLEKDLIKQVQICQQNQEYFTRLGDIRRVNQFEKLGTSCKKDLVALRHAFKLGDPAPRFRYEMRTFPSLQSCPDLGEDDLEIGIVRGLQVKLPSGYEDKDAEIFVRFEFPFPQEAPQSGKTQTIKGTSSPGFNERHKLKINRKARALQRLIKRHGIKVEVFQKGGFMRSDKSLGQCEIKLLALETKAEIHESLDLLDGRKACGGKLEVRVRIRDPMLQKEAEEVREKWLVIHEFIRASNLGRRTQQAAVSNTQKEGHSELRVGMQKPRAVTPERKPAGLERPLPVENEGKPQGKVVYGLPKIHT